MFNNKTNEQIKIGISKAIDFLSVEFINKNINKNSKKTIKVILDNKATIVTTDETIINKIKKNKYFNFLKTNS